MEDNIKDAISANIAVHSAMANDYNTIEPHFRPESIKRVDDIIQKLHKESAFSKVLDLGCGTGFMINIVKKYASEIVGVDVTQAMMDKVDKSGNASITLINSDTGTVELPQKHFDLATAYTFLDHLYDMKPTFSNAFNALKDGGIFYADLSPNYYFWNDVKKVDATKQYDPILQREINAVLSKDAEIEAQFGIDKNIFQTAEHQKHIKGGLVEEELRDLLIEAGFKKVEFIYHWFIGQAQLINDENTEKTKRFEQAEIMHDYLTKALPVSRNMFKYIGFIATK
ncbi:class I SAM-dependent DNA methyltransferase [Flavobacterium facile]|uniref:class I SAM-dependent DNA methyltransferase n=1 Tax=Flavobacterium facile TaxID=2893174 RepID=UPI002E772000|nr:class I SAM-dependent methyltransferase [Flavobacterium sp. T-12]